MREFSSFGSVKRRGSAHELKPNIIEEAKKDYFDLIMDVGARLVQMVLFFFFFWCTVISDYGEYLFCHVLV